MKRVFAAIVAFSFALLLPLEASAVPYDGYSYDHWRTAIPANLGYLPEDVFYGDNEAKVNFKAPEDFFVDEEGNFYVLNTGDGSVVILDAQRNLVRHLTEFKSEDGSLHTLFNPKGIFVKDDLLYIADTDNMAVIVSDLSGNVKIVIEKPDSPTYPSESEFRPLKVLADSQNRIYVLALGIYQGACVFDAKGEFLGYFGGNEVHPGVRLLMDRFWKRFLTDEQADSISNYVPVQFSGFDIAEKDFIYTCTSNNQYMLSEIRLINPYGKNIRAADSQGDYEVAWYKNKGYYSAFVDVCAVGENYLYALDATKGRIFTYDKDGELLMIFGGKGDQKGTFGMPAAIEAHGGRIFVLDSAKNSVTSFVPTEYGEKVFRALEYLEAGDYEAAKAVWESVLKMDGNLYRAYEGIGKALYYSGDYKASMEYFEKANAKAFHSKAFTEYRALVVRRWFPRVMTAVGALIAAGIAVRFVRALRNRKGKGR